MQSSSVRYPIALFLGGIAIGVAEFLPVGLLPDIARSLGISIPDAGHLLSSYAIGVVVGAPVLVALGSRMPPKRVLIAFMLLFALFNGLFALASSYPVLVAVRFLAGLPHGAFFALGAIVASRLAPRGQQAAAVAIMFAGLTAANVVFVPVGTYVGHVLSWRLPFAMVSVLALVTAWAIHAQIPAIRALPESGIAATLRHVTAPSFWPFVGISAIGTGGLYAWISYIAPLATEVTGFARSDVGLIMILAGLGMAAGNWLGGWLADRYPALHVVRATLMAMMVSVSLVAAVSQYRAATLALTFVTGAVAFSIIAPLQMLMLEAVPGSKSMASALMQSTSNVGNALGAYLGGLGIALGYGFASPEYIGAALVSIGLLSAFLIRGDREIAACTDPT
jgi:DHA1 family arabinose polymer transporter-like MFS transporter